MLVVHAARPLPEMGVRLGRRPHPQGNASFSLENATRIAPSSDLFEPARDRLRGGPEPPGEGVGLCWADRRLDTVDSRLTEAVPPFRDRFRAMSEGFDVVAALMVATTLLAPIYLETYVLQGVKQLLSQKQSVERAARRGRQIDLPGLLPSRYLSTSPRQRANLELPLRQDTHRLLFPEQCVITQRQGYAEALDLKRPVWTIRKTAAQDAGREIREVLSLVKVRLDALEETWP